MRDGELVGRVAVVTGAGSGLGQAVATGMAARGMLVAVLDMDGAAAHRVAGTLGAAVVAIHADVRDERSVARAFETIGERLGPPYLLVNNAAAGFGEGNHPEAIPAAAWSNTLMTNLTGLFFCCQHAARHMIPRREGSIVNIASIAGVSALGRGRPAYGVSKAGVIQLTRELAVAWARHTVRVNAILPCQIRTPPLESLRSDRRYATQISRMLEGIPMRRFADPEDIVGPVAFLASSAAAMVTGVALAVDGGNLALNAGGIHDWEPVDRK